MTLQMMLDEEREGGRSEGRDTLLSALRALAVGHSESDLIAEGIDNETISKAKEFLQSTMPGVASWKN